MIWMASLLSTFSPPWAVNQAANGTPEASVWRGLEFVAVEWEPRRLIQISACEDRSVDVLGGRSGKQVVTQVLRSDL